MAAPHQIDADTVVCWRFNEARLDTPANEASGSGPALSAPAAWPSIVAGKFGNARHFDGSTTYLQNYAVPGQVTATSGSMTFACWFKLDPAMALNGTNMWFIDFTEPSSLLRNFGCLIRRSDLKMACSWKRADGLFGGTGFFDYAFSLDTEYHLEIIRRITSASVGATEVEQWVNGVLQQTWVHTSSNAPGDWSGSNDSFRWTLGYEPAAGSHYFHGWIDDIIIRSRANTQAQVLADYSGSYSVSDGNPPIISNITPTSGTTITKNTTVQFDVTDPESNLADVTVLAKYQTLSTFEVVYFSGSFGPQYSGSRASITDGYRFSNVIRIGGWPASPTFYADAHDTSGNST